MPEQPYLPLYTGDWKRKRNLQKCRAEGRAVWIEALMAMHDEGTYELAGTIEDLVLVLSLPAEQIIEGIAQLERNDVCDASRSDNGVITLISRRRLKEHYARENARERAKRYRERKTSRDDNAGIVPLDIESDSDTTTEVEVKKKKEKVSFSDSTIEDIYQLYPRKVGKTAALNAIRKALQRLSARGQPDPAVWMTQRVEVFAASPAGQAGKYCPHPSTWFNQDRFDDDENEWQRDNEPDQRTHTGSQRNVPIREQLQREYGEGRNGVGLADAGGHYAAVHRLPPAVGS